MIDLHCHILPGADDGAADLHEALLMARMAYDSGTRTLVATPHFGFGDGQLSPETIRDSAARLQHLARQEGLELSILPGMELICTRQLAQILQDKQYLTLAGSRYLLTEFFFDEDPAAMNRMLEMVAEHGLTPMIAHPERYDAVQRDPYLAEYWMEQGYGIQINSGSLLGNLGKGAQMAGKWLVHNGLAHVVASDGHGMETRTPRLKAAREYLEDHVSLSCARALLLDNPRLVLQDRPLPRY